MHTPTTRSRTRRKNIWQIALLLLLLAGVSAPLALPSYAQSQSFHWDRYDANITVNTDGSIDVVETLVYVYDQGRFHRGNRAIPVDRVDSLSNLKVSENVGGLYVDYRETSYDPDNSSYGEPGTFGTVQDGNLIRIRWVYDYTSNDSRTFRLSYHAAGAIRIYPDHDELDWYAVPQDAGGPINSSRVQVTLPRGMDASKLIAASSNNAAERGVQGNAVVWTTSSNLANGFEVGVQMPKGIVQASPPAWQQEVDRQEKQQAEQRAQQENYDKNVRPLVDFAVLGLSVLLFFAGILWSIMRWYKGGRDKPVKLFAEYITEPPSNLPPGLVGTLIDERADVRDVIATVVDQGRKGNLTIQEVETGGMLGLFKSKDYRYEQTGNNVDYPYEQMVLQAVFKSGGQVLLSNLKNSFYSDLPGIYSEMYNTVVRLGLFPENPQATRARNSAFGILFILIAGAAAVAALLFGSTISYMLWLLPIAISPTGVVILATAGAMPKKSDQGAEETAKWKAFARYLQQMRQYTDVRAAADKFSQYLPYAVALGVENELTRQFNDVPAAMPPYYMPVGYGPGMFYPYPAGNVAGSGMGNSGPGGSMPQLDPGGAMQGMSNSISGAMQGMSDSFTQMVNSASNILTSTPAPTSSGGGFSGGGGGWGGGGGSFGGGGGGGGSAGAD